jgi:hypothetical protein
MKINKITQLVFCTLSLIAFPVQGISINDAGNLGAGYNSLSRASSEQIIKLQATSGDTIEFMTQNGSTVNELDAQRLDLPYLVLYRNGELTPSTERTLSVSLTGVEIPSPGVTVTLQIETQHGDPDLGGGDENRITVWRDTQWLANTSTTGKNLANMDFVYTFDARINSGIESIPTPTDYFRYEITVIDQNHTFIDPLYTFRRDYAFLMENQWVTQLPEVQEEAEDAAPDEIIIYYCDMFPFQGKLFDKSTWLRREAVHDYVGTDLLPAMAEAFLIQTNEWGFTWHEAWYSFRPGEDAERLSVALTDGRTWYHSRALLVGHAGISINVKAGQHYGRVDYASLTDKLMSVFQHELFHNLQRDIFLHYGGEGDLAGNEGAWEFFTEGTAVLASTIGQADMQLTQATQARDYMFKIKNFQLEGFDRGYTEMDAHQAALYWRFLYEQCGGMKDAVEDPGAGMGIIGRALNVLYSNEIVDIYTSSDLISELPAVMDRALKSSSCPFTTYEESLVHFGNAIQALLLES